MIGKSRIRIMKTVYLQKEKMLRILNVLPPTLAKRSLVHMETPLFISFMLDYEPLNDIGNIYMLKGRDEFNYNSSHQ